MFVSDAKRLANANNSKKSTGPRTERGKARSRANAMKHGLTGEGMCLGNEDAGQLETQLVAINDDLKPQTERERVKARRAAVLIVRIDRCYVKDTATVRKSVRDAIDNYDEQVTAEFRANIHLFHTEPADALRQLKRTAQGIDWMVDHWKTLGEMFARNKTLDHNELERADQLMGRKPGAAGRSRVQDLERLSRSGVADACFNYEPWMTPEGLAPIKAAAKLELEAFFVQQVENLLAHRATLRHDDVELDRVEAPLRAVVDLSNTGQLLRRYETAAARELHKIFDHFDELEAQAPPEIVDATPEPIEPSETVGSFGNSAEAQTPEPAVEPEPAQIHPDRPVNDPNPPQIGFDRPFDRPARE